MPAHARLLVALVVAVCCPLPLVPTQQFVDALPPPLVNHYYAPADLDGDGFVDLVSVSEGVVRLHRNDGQNRFGEVIPISTLPAVNQGVVADFDGDGDRDLVTFAPGSVANPAKALHLIRNGGATFTTTNVFQPPVNCNYASFVQAVDIDGDGDQDLVCALYDNSLVFLHHHVLTNDGTGQFTDVTVAWAPNAWGSTRAHVLDVDLDGRPDLLLEGITLRLLRNTGGSFVDETALRLPASASAARGAALGDIEGDGDLDIVAIVPQQPLLLLRDDAGVFTDVTATQLTLVTGVEQAVFYDADSDGDRDLYARGVQAATLVINNGAGGLLSTAPATRFGPEVTSLAGQFSKDPITATDLEGDGDTDLVLAALGVGILRNNRAGVLADPWALTRLSPTGRAVLDVDSDGDLDLLHPNGWFANDGIGGFAQQPFAGTPPLVWPYTVVGDLDGDGDDDFVGNFVCLNNGGGAFTSSSITGGAFPISFGKALADMDGDGDLDLALTDYGWQPRIYRNNGAGAFSLAATLPTGTHSAFVDCDDFDGDGDLDLLFSGTTGGPGVIQVLANQGGAVFALVGSLVSPGFASWVRINGTGLPDIVVTGIVPRVLRFQAGVFFDITATTMPSGFTAMGIASGDVDGDGDIDLCGDQLLRNDGTGVFQLEPLGVEPPSAVGPDGLWDFDGDGDLDLLVRSSGSFVAWNREHQLVLPLPARVGRPLRIDVSALPGRATPLEFAVVGIGLVLLNPGLALPFGELHIGSIGLTLGTPITPVLGLTELDLPIPADPTAVGLDLHFQALHVGPGGWLLGNVASTRIE